MNIPYVTKSVSKRRTNISCFKHVKTAQPIPISVSTPLHSSVSTVEPVKIAF